MGLRSVTKVRAHAHTSRTLKLISIHSKRLLFPPFSLVLHSFSPFSSLLMAPWGGLESLRFIQLFLKEVKKGKKKKRKKDKEAQPAGHRHSETDREKQSERLSRDKAWTFTLLANIAVGKPNTATQTA